MARSPALGLSCDCQERKQLELPAQLEVQVRWKKKKKSQKAKKRKHTAIFGRSGHFWAHKPRWDTSGSIEPHQGRCSTLGAVTALKEAGWCVGASSGVGLGLGLFLFLFLVSVCE